MIWKEKKKYLQLPYMILNRTDKVWKISIPIIDVDTTLESVVINVEIRNIGRI